jgi:eukaryotic-like serine/threonine-protein kinase
MGLESDDASPGDDPAPAVQRAAEQGAATSLEPSPTEVLLRQKLSGAEAPPAALTAGAYVGYFRVIAPLGRGGMGYVYRAEDERLRREVALKVLPPFHSGDVERRRRLLREARAAAAVNHPNIATVYEVGEAEGRIYIAMELIHGQSLGQRLRAGRLSLEEALSISLQILRGISKAHKAGLIHRDLKPDNVMLTDEGVAKVLDFGLAKQHAEPSVDMRSSSPDSVEILHRPTLSGPVIGTPEYMSPEQAHRLPIDHRSDLFSFGVMLYEMLAGQIPFKGDTVSALLTAVVRQAPAPLSQLNPEVRPDLAQLVEQCLAKNPADRYPDCDELASHLERIAQQTIVSLSSPTVALPSRRSRPWAGRWALGVSVRKLSLVAGALALLGIGAVSVWHLRSSPLRSSALSSTPTAITDLPPPTSASPEAIAAYKAALHSMRDGNWGQAEEYLKRAITFDPLMAAAHLHLSLRFEQNGATAQSRASYGRATQSRGSLSERDQVLFRALQPALSVDPPDHALTAAQLREATARYPFDAEIFLLLAYFEDQDPEASLRAAKRASELDPQYADAWQMVGFRLAELDRTEEALGAFDRCLSISPITADCRSTRADLYEQLGRCADMEEEYRRAISGSPTPVSLWYGNRAEALYALGRPAETVHEAFTQKWAQVPEAERRPIELYDQARLDFELGQFALAEARALEGIRLIQSERDASIHANYATLLVWIYRETGRLKEAAAVAGDYLKRKDGWGGESSVRNVTMRMLRTMFHAGALSKEAFGSARAKWLAERREALETDPSSLWFPAYVNTIERPEEAAEAIAALAELPKEALPDPLPRRHNASMGKLYLLAGRAAEAVPLLRPSNQPCTGPGTGQALTLSLGQALEQTGDKDGACAAYANVLEHWGNGSPRSITAEKARARAQGLSCSTRKPPSASSP